MSLICYLFNHPLLLGKLEEQNSVLSDIWVLWLLFIFSIFFSYGEMFSLILSITIVTEIYTGCVG